MCAIITDYTDQTVRKHDRSLKMFTTLTKSVKLSLQTSRNGELLKHSQ